MTKPSWQDFGTHDESIVPELWDGVVGAWAPCLGPTGSRLHDMSGRANWGTLTNMDPPTDWVLSDGQYALDFDGVNDEVLCNNNAALDQATAGTVSMWYRPATVSGLQALINQWNVNGPQAGVYLFQNGAAIVWQVGSATGRRIDAASVFVANRWAHVVATFSASAMQIIINGRVQTEGAAPGAANSRGVATRIGAGDGGIGFANGLIDDAIIWNRALTPNESRQLYQLGRGGMYHRRRRRAIYLPQDGGAVVITPPTAGWTATTQHRHWIARTQQRFFISSSQQRLWRSEGNQ